jgi:hypothetical protein
MKQLVVCVDFDGTLHDPYNVQPGQRMGVPIAGAHAAIHTLRHNGYRVVVCTARPDVAHVWAWLRYFNFQVDDVTHEKPLAHVYIDDRGFRFTGDWARTAYEVDRLLRSGHDRSSAQDPCPGPACYGEGNVCYLHTDADDDLEYERWRERSFRD